MVEPLFIFLQQLGKALFLANSFLTNILSDARTIKMGCSGLPWENWVTEKAAMQVEPWCWTRERTRQKAHFYFQNGIIHHLWTISSQEVSDKFTK